MSTVTGDRVAAMTALGIANRYPGFGSIFLDHDPVVRFPGSGTGPGQRLRPDRPAMDRYDLDGQWHVLTDLAGERFAIFTMAS